LTPVSILFSAYIFLSVKIFVGFIKTFHCQ
jgi:hypothetical protein